MSHWIEFIQVHRIQIFSIVGSIALFLLIVRLIQKRKLKEEHSLLWLAVFLFFIVISICKPLLELLAQVAGIFYAPAALLLFLILGVLMILIHYATIISKLSEQNKTLIQEVAMLKERLPGSSPKSPGETP